MRHSEVSILAVSGSQGARLRGSSGPTGPRGKEIYCQTGGAPWAGIWAYTFLVLAMTSWFIGVEASVISGALLYSKDIRFWFPVGKRLVLAARRPYI